MNRPQRGYKGMVSLEVLHRLLAPSISSFTQFLILNFGVSFDVSSQQFSVWEFNWCSVGLPDYRVCSAVRSAENGPCTPYPTLTHLKKCEAIGRAAALEPCRIGVGL
jgi:hypothetical protein